MKMFEIAMVIAGIVVAGSAQANARNLVLKGQQVDSLIAALALAGSSASTDG